MLKTACLLLLVVDDKMYVPGLDCAVVSTSAGKEAEPHILKLGKWWISLSVQSINMKLMRYDQKKNEVSVQRLNQWTECTAASDTE